MVLSVLRRGLQFVFSHQNQRMTLLKCLLSHQVLGGWPTYPSVIKQTKFRLFNYLLLISLVLDFWHVLRACTIVAFYKHLVHLVCTTI
jgi:hypothetical protein